MEHISVTEPINLALERVGRLLFRPFDLGKWFTIGFCAWLAQLGERGFRANFGANTGSGNHGGDIHQQWNHARDFVQDNLYWLIPVVIAAVVFVIVLSVLLLWLNSRGKFMFLYCVALDRAEVSEPWRRFAQAGNSLFLFRIVLGLIGLLITLPLIAVMVLSAISMFRHDAANFVGIMVEICLLFTLIIIGFLFALIRKLTFDFVVPIMFLRGSRCLAAWSEFWRLLWSNAGEFALYILFQIAITLVIGMMVIAVVVITCCIAGCLLAIPYIGTVFFLPVFVFKRSYSLHYLAQYGPTYNVFSPATLPA